MKKFFSNLSIKSKLLFSHIILIAIPTVVIVALFYSRIYNLIVNDSIQQEQAISLQTSASVSATLNQIVTIAGAVRDNPYLDSISKGGDGDMEGLSQNERDAFISLVKEQTKDELITAIHVYSDNVPESYYNGALGEVFRPISETKGTYWHGIFDGSDRDSLFCPSFYLKGADEEYGGLALIYRLSSTGSNAGENYLAVYFSKYYLTKTLQNGISINDSVYYIINERESLVAASNDSLSGTYRMSYDTASEIEQGFNQFTTKTILNTEVYTGCHKLGKSDWIMVSVLPAAPIRQKGYTVIINFVLLYVLMLVVALVIAEFMSSSITKRLDVVSSQMRKVRREPPVRIPESNTHDEIGDLITSYNYMTDKMNLMIEQQARDAEELRVSEIRALQAQINPHFLYNTMDMINWRAQTGKPREVSEAIQALSKFYKLTLSKKGIYGTIASETEHVTLYIQLQNMRFNGRIHFVSDIPDEMNDCIIPKLTFQPIVENSILHGILEKTTREGTIVITAWSEGNDIVIQISDDGIGIEGDQLGTILSEKADRTDRTNIGVYNTHRRLRVIYGPGYGLKYSSIYGKGTDVEIRVPRRISEAE